MIKFKYILLIFLINILNIETSYGECKVKLCSILKFLIEDNVICNFIQNSKDSLIQENIYEDSVGRLYYKSNVNKTTYNCAEESIVFYINSDQIRDFDYDRSSCNIDNIYINNEVIKSSLNTNHFNFQVIKVQSNELLVALLHYKTNTLIRYWFFVDNDNKLFLLRKNLSVF